MNPGRELDKLIAEIVFGAEVEVLNQKAGWRIDLRAKDNECNDPIMTDWGSDGYRLKRFSTDIKAAWEIVDKLGKNGTQWRFSNKAFSNTYWWAYTEDAVSQGDTLPHAICLTALKHMQEQAK
jgi:hypothetical protein